MANVVEEPTEDYSSRLTAVIDIVAEADNYMDAAINMAANGIVWSSVDASEIKATLDEIKSKATSLAKTIG